MRYLKAFLLSFLALGLVVGTMPAQAQMKVQDAYQGPGELANAVQFGGYFELDYTDKEGSPSAFDAHRTILFFGAQPHERLTFFNELEIEHGGIESEPSEGELEPYIKLEQSWLEYAIGGGQNFRAGIDLIPVGRLNINHDGNLRDFVFRPYLDGKLIPTTWFESGVEFNGSLTSTLSYQVGVSNGIHESDFGLADEENTVGTRNEFAAMVSDALDERDVSGSKATYGRLAWSPILGTEIGLSGYQTKYDRDPEEKSIRFLALDFNTIQGPWEFTGEFVNIDKDQETNQVGATEGLKGANGARLEAAYHFWPDALYDSFLGRGFDNPTFTALARYEDLNYDVPESRNVNLDESYYSVGFNYRPIERVAYKLSYDIQNLEEEGATEHNRFGFGAVIGF